MSGFSADSAESPDITLMLRAWSNGDPLALDRLMPLVYEELRRTARGYTRRHPGEHTLQPTALANEAFLRLVGAQGLEWKDRAHFYAVAAQMMRRLLVDATRARCAAKRQGYGLRITFTEQMPVRASEDASLLALDEALSELAKQDARKGLVVELRYFGGLSVEETAVVLKISPQSVLRDWRVAKAWLARELDRGGRHAA